MPNADNGALSPSLPLHEVLPVEIMSKIFIEVCNMKRHTTRESQIHTLSTVCLPWKSIVLSIPQLYSSYSLTIDHCKVEQQALDLRLKRVIEWFDQASAQPCDLHVMVTGCLTLADIRISMTPLVEEIGGRLKNLWLRGEQRELDRMMQVFSIREVPMLETLYIRRRSDYSEPYSVSPSFVNAKRLKSVDLVNVSEDNLDWSTFLPYDQLTTITIRDAGIKLDIIILILSSSTNLVDCEILHPRPYNMGDPEATVNTCMPISLPSLRRLSTTYLPSIVFSALHIPALKVLELHRYWNPEDILSDLIKLYHRAPFELQTLKVYDTILSVHGLTPLFELVRNLEALHFISCSFSSGSASIFESLKISGGTRPDLDARGSSDSSVSSAILLLPNLRHLTVSIRDVVPVSVITQFVESRLRSFEGCKRLQSLVLKGSALRIDQATLEGWERKGVSVHLTKGDRQ